MKKKLLVSLLAVVVMLSVVAVCFLGCGNNATEPEKTNFKTKTDAEIYQDVLGEYYAAMQALDDIDDADEAFGAMAIAEAKLLETGVFFPTTSKGGMYGISRVCPGTVSPIGWGNDQSRFHNVVLTTTPISAAHREELKAHYAEVKGDGTYEAWAKNYLTTHDYTLKNTYTFGYSADPETWDITNTYWASDSEAIVNTFDNLIEYDNEGIMRPALATSWEVSADGLKYTFHIREGVKWVDQDGNDRANVTANDWVYGLQRVLDNGYTSYLVMGYVDGATEYATGETEDFSTVGVKAIDDYTLEYTLEAPCNYFLTMFNYNPYAPVNKAFAESLYDEEEDEDNYGTSPANILYCGPYIVTNFTADNTIVFSANAKYWNKDNINIQTITWKSYAENKDVTKLYNDMKAGTIDSCSLNATTIELAKTENMWDYVFVSGTDSTTYSFFINVDRTCYETVKKYGMQSPQTSKQKEISYAAFQNKNFRMAFCRGLDRASYNAQEVGEDCKLFSLQNAMTPGSFVQLSKNITLDINGTPTNFAAGTYYGAMVQAQLDADMGANAMKVWDPTLEGGLGSSSGFDGWYNANLAKSYLNAAIAELAKQGYEISASNPIYIDYPYWNYETYANRAQAMKEQVETLFEGKVKINLVSTEDVYGWYYAGYYAGSGDECNFSIYDCSGWGPDYGDPSTYLNIMLPGGDMEHCIGLD